VGWGGGLRLTYLGSWLQMRRFSQLLPRIRAPVGYYPVARSCLGRVPHFVPLS
jgi:hypothetical protein